MTWLATNFSRNIRLRTWYVFITTIPKRVCFIAKVELPSVSIEEAASFGLEPSHVQCRVSYFYLPVTRKMAELENNTGSLVRRWPVLGYINELRCCAYLGTVTKSR